MEGVAPCFSHYGMHPRAIVSSQTLRLRFGVPQVVVQVWLGYEVGIKRGLLSPLKAPDA